MNKIPLLSICIPTYNRSATLRQSLYNLLVYDGTEIEFVISDNASPDDTAKMIASLSDYRIQYFRNDSNIGAMLNIIKTFQVARGEWIFTLSDEDYATPEMLSRLLMAVEDPQYVQAAVMLGNIRNETGSYPYYGYHNGADYVPYKWGNRLFSKGDAAIHGVGFHHKYLSGVMIRRSAIDFKALAVYADRACGVAPHTYAYTKACAEGDVATLDLDFVIKTDQNTAKSHAESVDTKHYRHPRNRYRTFECYIDLTEYLMHDFRMKSAAMARLYGYYLDEGTYGWHHLLTHQGRAKRYGVEAEGFFDLKAEVKRFDERARLKFRSIIIDEDEFHFIEQILDEKLLYFKRKRDLI